MRKFIINILLNLVYILNRNENPIKAGQRNLKRQEQEAFVLFNNTQYCFCSNTFSSPEDIKNHAQIVKVICAYKSKTESTTLVHVKTTEGLYMHVHHSWLHTFEEVGVPYLKRKYLYKKYKKIFHRVT